MIEQPHLCYVDKYCHGYTLPMKVTINDPDHRSIDMHDSEHSRQDAELRGRRSQENYVRGHPRSESDKQGVEAQLCNPGQQQSAVGAEVRCRWHVWSVEAH